MGRERSYLLCRLAPFRRLLRTVRKGLHMRLLLSFIRRSICQSSQLCTIILHTFGTLKLAHATGVKSILSFSLWSHTGRRKIDTFDTQAYALYLFPLSFKFFSSLSSPPIYYHSNFFLSIFTFSWTNLLTKQNLITQAIMPETEYLGGKVWELYFPFRARILLLSVFFFNFGVWNNNREGESLYTCVFSFLFIFFCWKGGFNSLVGVVS